MQTEHAVTGRWEGGYREAELKDWLSKLRSELAAPQVTLGLVFMAPALFPNAEELLELIRLHAQAPLLAGCSSSGFVAGGEEFEEEAGFVLALYSMPGAKLSAFHFTQEQLDESTGPGYWHLETGVGPEESNGWLVFADPFNLHPEAWLRNWNEAYPEVPIFGGLAVGDYSARLTQVYLNDEVHEEGGVAISFGDGVAIAGITSQGCTPIGETWTLTKVDQNIIQQIGNRPAYDVLVETFSNLTPEEQQRTQGNLLVGLAMNEYVEDFHRGDFLVRNLQGVDRKSGAIAVGALPRAGQTIQFQRRDASAATADMEQLLGRAGKSLAGATIYGGCLCCCNGRGSNLFGAPGHDARMVQERLGPLGLVGLFCNGEIGSLGGKSYLHAYTASLALFVKPS